MAAAATDSMDVASTIMSRRQGLSVGNMGTRFISNCNRGLILPLPQLSHMWY